MHVLFSTLTEVFPCFFLQFYGKCQGIPRKDGARPALFLNYVVPCINCVVYVLFVCKCVLLPPGVNSIAVKYIISHQFYNG